MLLTRFAPSPTGYLHLGHVANAVYVWGVARVMKARVLLRIEDHDRVRSRRVFEEALLEDLDWLGFIADDGRRPVVRQSDRDEVYRNALRELRQRYHVYACDCSRKDILLRAGRFGGQVGGERYDGRCRRRGIADGPGRGLRVQIDEEPERFDDLLLGRIEQKPSEQCGDILLRDRDGHWTYQFAVTVDDMQQGITLVIRGEDLLSSTARQIKLGRMMGRTIAPSYLHHPLIEKHGTSLRRSGRQQGMALSRSGRERPGQKLSKAAGDTGIRDLRTRGFSSEEVIGRAATAIGLIDTYRPIAAHDVASVFQGAVFRRTYSP